MKKLLCLLIFLFISEGYAGKEGGGGRAIVCSDVRGNIESVELLDFYEGRSLEGHTYAESSLKYINLLEKQVMRIPRANLKNKIMQTSRKIKKGLRFLPKGVRLKKINDSAEIFIPSNCKVEQVANFQGLGRVFIVSDFWNKMDNLSRAGLLLHEVLWFYDRSAGAKTSTRIRRDVSRVFASNFQFKTKDLQLFEGDIHCESFNNNHAYVDLAYSNSFIIRKRESDILFIFDILNNNMMIQPQTHIMQISKYSSFFTRDLISYDVDINDYINFTDSFVLTDQQFDTHIIQIRTKMDLSREADIDVDGNELVSLEKYIKIGNLEFPGYDDNKFSELECEKIDKNRADRLTSRIK